MSGGFHPQALDQALRFLRVKEATRPAIIEQFERIIAEKPTEFLQESLDTNVFVNTLIRQELHKRGIV